MPRAIEIGRAGRALRKIASSNSVKKRPVMMPMKQLNTVNMSGSRAARPIKTPFALKVWLKQQQVPQVLYQPSL